MKWLRLHRKDALVISLTLLLPLYAFLHLATSFVQHSLESRDEIAKITPRISRLLGLVDSEQKMQESLLIVSDGSKSLTYPSTEEESVISATLQAELRRIMTEAGLTVSNSQVQKMRREGKFDHIGLNVTSLGTIEALDLALAGLESYRPLVLIESLNVYPNRKKSAAQTNYRQTVTARFKLTSLRVTQ